MRKGIKVALDPTPRQEQALWSHAGAARFAFNIALLHIRSQLSGCTPVQDKGRAWNRFVSGWQDAKQAANAAHSNPNNTVMRDFWDGQFKRFGDWSKGHGWSIGNTIMNARTGYTDFRGIHDMKNIAAVDTRRTVWDTMNIGLSLFGVGEWVGGVVLVG